jgi:hypothetical protein
MKKYFFFSLLIFVFSILLSNTTNAQEKLIYEKEEITDLAKLFDRAVNGIEEFDLKRNNLEQYTLTNDITNIGINKFNSLENILTSKNSNDGIKVSEYATSQLLKVEIDEDTEIKDYAITTFTIVEEAASVSTLNSKSREGWDESIGVKAYSTIYVSVYTKNNYTYAKLSNGSGGWIVNDGSLTISNRKVILGTSGVPVGTQKITHTPSSNSWSYTAPSSWESVITSSTYAVGITTDVTIQRRSGTNTWILRLVNQI